MKWKIPLFKTYSDDQDVEAVSRIIKRGTYWADGPEIKEFEEKLAKFLDVKYALVFNSGTSALHTLLLAHDVKHKDVIVPSFTFIATANTVVLTGGNPVFAESESETYGLDADDVEKRITKNTKAIITLQYGGFPSRDTEKLKKIADNHKILFIEDAAESLGAELNGKKIGTFGDSAIFSFCQNKIISTGEGGAIVTNSKEVYEKARLIRSHGRVEDDKGYFSSVLDNDYSEVGYNFRMPSMLAALGLSQLGKIKKIIKMRREHADYMDKRLRGMVGVVKKEHYQVYQMYPIQLKDKKTRDSLQDYLSKNKVMTKVYFNPIHLKALYKKRFGYKEGDLPKTEEFSKRVLNLPIYPDMEKKDLDYMINKIKKVMEELK